jgi:nitroimidazol reductase NimA-like FMN-containing flavoprotein (pyridoxamine 5'-phosphate oxidase superfamily)
MSKEDILKYISERHFAVIATKGEPYPESACVEFGNDGFTLIFDTNKNSRKFKNLQKAQEVSLVIGWEDERTVQYEGIATLLSEGEELERLKRSYFDKSPGAKKWENKKDSVYFKVEPKWVRYTDLNFEPWQITELNF